MRHGLRGSIGLAVALAIVVVMQPLSSAAAVGRAPGITANRPPDAPTDLLSDGKVCATGAARPYVLTVTPVLAARQSDPDPQSLTTSFYWWPSGGTRSDERMVSQMAGNQSGVAAALPAGALTDGSTYVWQARTHDGSVSGPWSQECEFTVDITSPPAPASVTSADYTPSGFHGGVGIPGIFEVTAPSVIPEDMTGYAWTLDSAVGPASATQVAARPTDHGASIAIAPRHDGPNRVRVWSRDRAGRFSMSPVEYWFGVRPVIGSGAAAEWRFDEPGGPAVDASTNGNSASLSTEATRGAGRGGTGQALFLAGSDFAATAGPVLVPHPFTDVPTPIRTDTTFTVTARAMLTSTGGTGTQAIVAADGTRTSPFVLGYSGPDDRWRFVMAGADTDAAIGYEVLSDTAPTAGKWTHLAGVYDAGTGQLRLYVNGVLQSATATLTTAVNASGPVTIGRGMRAGADADFFTGAIDDVAVFTSAVPVAKLAAMAVPLQPTISFPNGNNAMAGGQLSVAFHANGDSNVTMFRYSVGNTSLDQQVAVNPAGGTAIVTINVGNTSGEHLVRAAAVDDGGRRGDMAQASFTVTSPPRVSGRVLGWLDSLPVEGALVTLNPGGMSMVTGPDGTFSFEGFPPGTYTLAVSIDAPCALFRSRTVSIDNHGLFTDLLPFPVNPDDPACAEMSAALRIPPRGM